MPTFTWQAGLQREADGSLSIKCVVILCGGREVIVQESNAVAQLWATLGKSNSSIWEQEVLQCAWHRHKKAT